MPKKNTRENNYSADFSVSNLITAKKPKKGHRRLFSDPSNPKIINEMTYSPLVYETGSSSKQKKTSEYSFKKGKNTKTTTNSAVSESRTSGHSSSNNKTPIVTKK